ncbi:uncharacterized protein JCM6883_007485 [Sporobolomyces salmoneus]|uniref:uncharacterized protein n=1 Tax=Sporobolomyces salmoneus TaxID=183962 RepID=UPI0031732C53
MLAYHSSEDPAPAVASFPTSLLPQLEIVSLPYEIAGLFGPEVRKQLDTITLWDFQWYDLDSATKAPVSHLRFEGADYNRDLENSDDLVRDWLAKTLRLRPSLLYLPSSSEELLCSNDQEDFKTGCKKLGIEIVLEEGEEKWYLDGGFSQDFRKRMEKKRIKKAKVE